MESRMTVRKGYGTALCSARIAEYFRGDSNGTRDRYELNDEELKDRKNATTRRAIVDLSRSDPHRSHAGLTEGVDTEGGRTRYLLKDSGNVF